MKNQAGMNPKKRNARPYVLLLAVTLFWLCVPCASMAADWDNGQLSCTVTVKETCPGLERFGMWKFISLVYVVTDDPQTTCTYECKRECDNSRRDYILTCNETKNVKNKYIIFRQGSGSVDAYAGKTKSQACKQVFDGVIRVFSNQ